MEMVDVTPKSEPFSCQKTVNTHFINGEGHDHGWENKYVELSEEGMIFKESADDTIRRGIIHLYDIVYCEQADEVSGPTPYNLRIKTRAKATYTFQLSSQEEFNAWADLLDRHKGVMREEDIHPPPPPKPVEKPLTFRRWWKHSWRYFEREKIYMLLGTIAYICLWSVLFALLWVLYVKPMKDITQVETQCYVLSHDSEYVYKKTYNLIMDVRYQLANGTVIENEMKQYCIGKNCPGEMDDKYPLNEYTTCYYDEDDIDFVFFDLSPFLKRRYSIVGGVCGGLIAPWVIFVLTWGYVKRKRIFKILKNGF